MATTEQWNEIVNRKDAVIEHLEATVAFLYDDMREVDRMILGMDHPGIREYCAAISDAVKRAQRAGQEPTGTESNDDL